MKPRVGHNLSKWCIYRHWNGSWFVCGPSASGRRLSDCPPPIPFASGAEALAAFAGGRK